MSSINSLSTIGAVGLSVYLIFFFVIVYASSAVYENRHTIHFYKKSFHTCIALAIFFDIIYYITLIRFDRYNWIIKLCCTITIMNDM